MNDAALILFFKYPEKGKIKTRLARELGDEFVLNLYTCFLEDLFAAAVPVKADKVIVYAGAAEPVSAVQGDDPGYAHLKQRGRDLGDKMYNALHDVFSMGYNYSLLMGSDCPGLPACIIEQGFGEVKKHDIVLGPSEDGGYYLVGMGRDSLDESIFAGIPWSTADVLKMTMRKAGETGMSIHLLPEWQDIDELDDLKKYYFNRKKSGIRSCTDKFLDDSKIFN